MIMIQVCNAQFTLGGSVTDLQGNPILDAEVYNKTTGAQTLTDGQGNYVFKNLSQGTYSIAVFNFNYDISEKEITITGNTTLDFQLKPLGEQLSEVVIQQRREKIFNLKQLKPVEGTAIYAGKKSEVVLLENTLGNLAVNNPRQIYAQVAGLNIYENSVGGLQLNIGGRGLDPNRTANFNTRQNGYDISADVLGYPESYYTPPAEALQEIQIVRGAASLQYGTQFGGLINFVMKKPESDTKLLWTSRQSIGSYNLFSSFNSFSGTISKFSYYTYFNYKKGNGFRPNTAFDSKNFYTHFGYAFSDKTRLNFEFTYLDYLAQQPGGLTDSLFEEDLEISLRSRNWFAVDWKLLSLRLEHEFSEKTDFSLNLFALDASRKAVGFRGVAGSLEINPVSVPDEMDFEGNFVNERDIIIGDFQNWGAEARLLSRYQLGNQESIFLIGSKYYQAANGGIQGPGSTGTNADFSIRTDEFPEYPNQSSYDFPNLNIAVFGENIFTLSDKLTVTPGIRFEYIKTAAEGFYTELRFDNSGNEISREIEEEDNQKERSFLLFGLGSSYQYHEDLELYMNVSQNYRSVTFNDIRTISPAFEVGEDISDEKGGTADIGIRGKWNNFISYDVTIFGLLYDDRIATFGNSRAKQERNNVGDAYIYGLESYFNADFSKLWLMDSNYSSSLFLNLALTDSQYTSDNVGQGIKGNKVEFIPTVNLKSGISVGYKNLISSLQYTYLSKQFTESSNAEKAVPGSLEEGIVGEIPAYGILDLSLSYTYKFLKLETGINNLLNNSYYTQRATGYPGPGIIPSEPITWYTTLQFQL